MTIHRSRSRTSRPAADRPLFARTGDAASSPWPWPAETRGTGSCRTLWMTPQARSCDRPRRVPQIRRVGTSGRASSGDRCPGRPANAERVDGGGTLNRAATARRESGVDAPRPAGSRRTAFEAARTPPQASFAAMPGVPPAFVCPQAPAEAVRGWHHTEHSTDVLGAAASISAIDRTPARNMSMLTGLQARRTPALRTRRGQLSKSGPARGNRLPKISLMRCGKSRSRKPAEGALFLRPAPATSTPDRPNVAGLGPLIGISRTAHRRMQTATGPPG